MKRSEKISFRLPAKYAALLEHQLLDEDEQSINLLCKNIVINALEKKLEKSEMPEENPAKNDFNEFSELQKKVENLSKITLEGFRFLFREADVGEEFERQIKDVEATYETSEESLDRIKPEYPHEIREPIISVNN